MEEFATQGKKAMRIPPPLIFLGGQSLEVRREAPFLASIPNILWHLGKEPTSQNPPGEPTFLAVVEKGAACQRNFPPS